MVSLVKVDHQVKMNIKCILLITLLTINFCLSSSEPNRMVGFNYVENSCEYLFTQLCQTGDQDYLAENLFRCFTDDLNPNNCNRDFLEDISSKKDLIQKYCANPVQYCIKWQQKYNCLRCEIPSMNSNYKSLDEMKKSFTFSIEQNDYKLKQIICQNKDPRLINFMLALLDMYLSNGKDFLPQCFRAKSNVIPQTSDRFVEWFCQDSIDTFDYKLGLGFPLQESANVLKLCRYFHYPIVFNFDTQVEHYWKIRLNQYSQERKQLYEKVLVRHFICLKPKDYFFRIDHYLWNLGKTTAKKHMLLIKCASMVNHEVAKMCYNKLSNLDLKSDPLKAENFEQMYCSTNWRFDSYQDDFNSCIQGNQGPPLIRSTCRDFDFYLRNEIFHYSILSDCGSKFSKDVFDSCSKTFLGPYANSKEPFQSWDKINEDLRFRIWLTGHCTNLNGGGSEFIQCALQGSG